MLAINEYAKWSARLSVCGECGLKYLNVNDGDFCKDCDDFFWKEEVENITPRCEFYEHLKVS